MNKDQVKLWYYLKDNELSLFRSVKDGLSKRVINAYDSQIKIIADDHDILKIDQSIHHRHSDSESTQSRSQLDTATKTPLVLPKNIIKEPTVILAYYLIVFPTDLAKQLETMLPKQQKQAVVDALTQLKPHRLPKEQLNQLISFICKQSETNTTQTFDAQKVRVMEMLVDESSSLKGPLSEYCFNPKKDFFLFSKHDQLTILNELNVTGKLIPFLVFFNKKHQQVFLSSFSTRQQALVLDSLSTENQTNHHYLEARNNVIDTVRELQLNQQIDSAIKSFTHG